MGAAVSTLAFPAPPKELGGQALLARPDLIYLTTAEDDEIAAVHIRRGARGTDRVILFSHGNAEDLGQMLPYLDLMAQLCASDVLAYDYCGYGLSEGSPSEEGCCSAIDAAYGYLLERFSPNRIFAFGRSIGSGPTIDLAVRHPEIRGIILQSPPESCARAVLGKIPSWLGYGLDVFRNYEKIGEVESPVLVMHGTNDDVVPIANGVAIHKACKHAAKPFWVPDAGHNNMPKEICLRRTRQFLDDLDGLSWGWRIYAEHLVTHISVAL